MRIMEKMEGWKAEINLLDPEIEEMEAFVEYMESHGMSHGVVSWSDREFRGDQRPRIHDTYGIKFGGRCHIDMGFTNENRESCHIMLGRYDAPRFIKFIKDLRRNKEGEKGLSTKIQ